MSRLWVVITIGSVACLATIGQASDWPGFRGPGGTAQSSEKQLPVEWSADKNVQWKVKIPGLAWSSPIVWGDKVFVTTADTEKLQKPTGPFARGFGGGGPGGAGPGGAGRFRAPQPSQIVPTFLQDRLNLTAGQKQQIEGLQKEVDGKLATILTEEQNKELKEMRPGFRRGGFGQVLPTAVQEMLNLKPEQKKQLEGLQKEVDDQLGKVLTAEQNKQLKEVRTGFGFGRGGAAGTGQIMPAFLQQRLNLSAEQNKQLEGLQKDVDGKLGKILTSEQNKQFRARPIGFGRGGGGGTGQILPAPLQDRLNLSAEQKKQLEELQGELDAQLAKVLTAEQSKQLKEMRQNRGGFGRGQQLPDAVYHWEIYCLDRTDGKVLWKQTAIEQKPPIPKFPTNSYATETPVTDGERIYAYFGMVGVVCYDFTGKLVW